MVQLKVEVTGNRAQAKCRVCQKRIDPNNVRIGVPVYQPGGMGIDLHHKASSNCHWHHAVCSLVVERSPDARSKCRHCDQKVPRDSLRVGVRGPTVKSTAWNHMDCLQHMFDPEQLKQAGIDVAAQFNPWWIMGYGAISLTDKETLARSLGCETKLDDIESQQQHTQRMSVVMAATKAQKDRQKGLAKRKRKEAKEASASVKTCRYG